MAKSTKSTKITYTVSDPLKDNSVNIAGTFNDWRVEPLTYIEPTKTYEYTINRSENSPIAGKYLFKFIINDQWLVDENYSSENDGNGNENNVIVFDYADDAETSNEDKVLKSVQDDIRNEPATPNPTPYDLSKQTTSTSNTATHFKPLTLTSDEQEAHSSETAASKQIPKTEFKQQNKYIPLTETANGTPREDIEHKTQYFNNTVPVQTSGAVGAGNEILDDTEVEPESDSEANQTTLTRNSHRAKNGGRPEDGEVAGHFGVGFFATILQLITEFFRRWFTSGGH